MEHTVLLVDDEANVLASLGRLLRREPYRVLTANGYDAALQVVRLQSVDAAIVDYHMPGRSGLDLLTTLRWEFPQIRRLMLTGDSSLDVAIRAINVGEIFRFIPKPCEADQVINAIRQALLQKDLEDQSRALLSKVREQGAVIQRLEAQHPGISLLERDQDGAVVIPDEDTMNLDALVQALRVENRAPAPRPA